MFSAFRNAFTYAPIGMALVDLSGRLLRVNGALCQITGYPAVELSARAFSDLSDPHDVHVDSLEMAELLDGQIQSYQVEKRYRHVSGRVVWVLLSVSVVRDDARRPLNLIVQVQDISERKELEGQLEYLVDHDYLTALFNGRYFERALAQETKSVARYGGGGAVLLLDLDHFKAVNDRFGHKAGDELLEAVAKALRDRIRETDVLARLGGDEFGIILPQVDARQAQLVAAGIVKALRDHAVTGTRCKIPVTASVGVALFAGLRDIAILAAADLAMYQAKKAGRDRFAVYRPQSASAKIIQAGRGGDQSRRVHARSA